MKVSTGTLTEGQLNWLIARRLGGDLRFPHLNRAASDLHQGGTIIIDEKLSVGPHLIGGVWYGDWVATCLSWEGRKHSSIVGQTMLIAAMRTHIHSTESDDYGLVEIPGVLL